MNTPAASSVLEVPRVKGMPEMETAKIKDLVGTIEHDLHHQFHKEGIPEHVQATLADAGFTSSKLYRFFGETAKEVKESAMLMGLNPKEDWKAAGIIAKLQLIWSNTAMCEVAEEKDRAEKTMLGITPSGSSTDYTTVRKQYESLPGNKKQKKRRLPGNSIIDKIEAELLTGEFKAPRLIELPSKEEVDAAEEARVAANGVQVFPVLSATGVARMTLPARTKVPPIEDSGDFRNRIDLLEAGIDSSKIKNPNH
jgi:hypothetical protein